MQVPYNLLNYGLLVLLNYVKSLNGPDSKAFIGLDEFIVRHLLQSAADKSVNHLPSNGDLKTALMAYSVKGPLRKHMCIGQKIKNNQILRVKRKIWKIWTT